MITSESNNNEFHRFYLEYEEELSMRLVGLFDKKRKRTILSLLRKGVEIPPIWGMLKLPEATLFLLPIGLKEVKGVIQPTTLASFMIMKDLREQKPIMVTFSSPHTIIFSSHAIRRYKERMELAPDTDFVDVCKHMLVNGCSRPKVFDDTGNVHGCDEDKRALNLIVPNGVYFGFLAGRTNVIHAETFLGTSDLRKDQEYLDANKSVYLAQWKRLQEAYVKGEYDIEQMRAQLLAISQQVSVKDGKFVELTPEGVREKNEEIKKKIQDPEYRAHTIECNRKKFDYKMLRKGYK